MTDLKAAKACAHHLQALAEPTRLRIFELLLAGPKNVSEIAKSLKVKIVNVSHHLGEMRQGGLVETEKQGRFVVYSLSELVTEGRDGTVLNLGWCRLVFDRR